MNKNYITSLETSQELKEILGDRETEFYWIKHKDKIDKEKMSFHESWYISDYHLYAKDTDFQHYEILEKYPAYSAQELFDILPYCIINENGIKFYLYIEKQKSGLYCGRYMTRRPDDFDMMCQIIQLPLPQLAAELLFYLHRNKLYEFKKEVVNG